MKMCGRVSLCHCIQLDQEARQVLTNKEIMRLTPPIIYRANTTLNCAYALFVDFLYKGSTEYAAPYKTSEVFKTGTQFFDIWKSRIDSFRPGDEYEIVDEYAKLLKLSKWYEWKDDSSSPSQASSASPTPFAKQSDTEPAQGEPNQKHSNTVWMRLSAFTGKPREEIIKVASEIGLLGTSGIDYKAPGKEGIP